MSILSTEQKLAYLEFHVMKYSLLLLGLLLSGCAQPPENPQYYGPNLNVHSDLVMRGQGSGRTLCNVLYERIGSGSKSISESCEPWPSGLPPPSFGESASVAPTTEKFYWKQRCVGYDTKDDGYTVCLPGESQPLGYGINSEYGRGKPCATTERFTLSEGCIHYNDQTTCGSFTVTKRTREVCSQIEQCTYTGCIVTPIEK
jgi:hypothetical protein